MPSMTLSLVKKTAMSLVLAALVAVPLTAIDVWDQASEDDNTFGTDNGLTHGTEQLHDLGAEAGWPTRIGTSSPTRLARPTKC